MTTVRSPAVRRALGVLPALVLALAPPLSAQLTDLQPGRNFPTATAAFGQGRSGATAIGDVDHDGDYDVAIGNGWDFNSELNFLYLNDGGAQGGTAGTFTDATATRFAGLPADRTRDLEFVDLDGDTDLDVFTANTGTSVNAFANAARSGSFRKSVGASKMACTSPRRAETSPPLSLN